MSSFDDIGVAMIPSGYKEDKLYSVLPNSGDGDFDFSRSTTATRVNSQGLIEEMSTNVPRLDYSGGVSCPVLLLEPQRTNLLPYSEDFTQWTPSKANSTFGAVSPSGELNATTITDDGSGGSSGVVRIQAANFNIIASTKYTFSAYVKANPNDQIVVNTRNDDALRGGTFNISTLTFTPQQGTETGEVQSFGNGYYRIITNWTSGTDTSIAIGIGFPTIVVDGTNSFILWGAQVEEGSYATSYIPTNGTSVTRNADVCNNAGTSATFNSTEGVLFAEIAALTSLVNLNNWLTINDGTSSNQIALGFETNEQTTVRVDVGGVLQAYISVTGDYSQNRKLAFKFKENDFALWIDGVKVGVDISGSTLSSGTLNSLQFHWGSGGNNVYGNTKQLIVFKEALTGYELAELTSLVNLNPFTFTVETNKTGVSNNDQFTLPLTDNGTVDIMVFWGDGTSDAITAFDQAEKTHTYPSAGTYEIKITGTLQGFRFDNGGDKNKMLDIKKWGIFDINVSKAFRNCSNVTQSATDVPIISTTSLSGTFQVAPKFNGNVSNWDVSSVTNFNSMFNRARLFNQDISYWDVSSAVNLTGMFREANIFNQDISGWDVSNIGNFKEMFRQARDFNQPIGSWTIKNVGNQNINMQRMFRQATSFDQSLANWDMEKVNNLEEFLLDAGLSTANYDATLIGWAAQNVRSGLTCDFGNSQYTAGGAAEAARNTLINTYSWTITDGGAA